MKLTPVEFDAAYPDGLLKTEGFAFEWKGMRFAVHQRREAYRLPRDTLSVSEVSSGFNVGVPTTARSDRKRAAADAVARLEALGEEKVRAAISKAAASRVTTRLTA